MGEVLPFPLYHSVWYKELIPQTDEIAPQAIGPANLPGFHPIALPNTTQGVTPSHLMVEAATIGDLDGVPLSDTVRAFHVIGFDDEAMVHSEAPGNIPQVVIFADGVG